MSPWAVAGGVGGKGCWIPFTIPFIIAPGAGAGGWAGAAAAKGSVEGKTNFPCIVEVGGSRVERLGTKDLSVAEA